MPASTLPLIDLGENNPDGDLPEVSLGEFDPAPVPQGAIDLPDQTIEAAIPEGQVALPEQAAPIKQLSDREIIANDPLFADAPTPEQELFSDINTGLSDLFVKPLQRGYQKFERSGAYFADSPELLAQQQLDINELGESDRVAQLQERVKGRSVPGSIYEFVTSPLAVTELTLEALSQSIPSLAAGAGLGAVGGMATGGPLGSALGMGAGAGMGSLATEYSNMVMEEMAGAGYDLTDPKQIEAAWADEEMMGRARQRGLDKGWPVALFDMISGGIAGKLYKPVAKAVSKADELTTAGKVAGAATEIGAQGTLGGAGEVAGSLNVGDEVDTFSVLAEVFGEVVPGSVESVVGAKLDADGVRRQAETDQFASEMDDVFAQTLSDRDVDTGAETGDNAPSAEAPTPGSAPSTTPTQSEPPSSMPVEGAQLSSSPVQVGDSKTSTVTTAKGRKVDAEWHVVDADDILTSDQEGYTSELQPRDREGRKASEGQVTHIAANLDPDLLGESPGAESGAPIIGPDGMVESGNGRIMALRNVYANDPEKAKQYREWIEGKTGTLLGDDFTNPVLVRKRTTEMTPEERQAFTLEANESAVASMSATEQANADAARLDDATMALLQPGGLNHLNNTEFVGRFLQNMNPAERGEFMQEDGTLSAPGSQRIQSAILAIAYGDKDNPTANKTLARILESQDSNAKSITNAMIEVAPEFAQVRKDVDSGRLGEEWDISAQLVEAVETVSQIRDRGQKIGNYLDQDQMFSHDPIVEELMRAFYNEDLTRAAGSKAIADTLRVYAETAIQSGQAVDMFGDENKTPGEVISESRKRAQGQEVESGAPEVDQPAGDEGAGGDAAGAGKEQKPTVSEEGGGSGPTDQGEISGTGQPGDTEGGAKTKAGEETQPVEDLIAEMEAEAAENYGKDGVFPKFGSSVRTRNGQTIELILTKDKNEKTRRVWTLDNDNITRKKLIETVALGDPETRDDGQYDDDQYVSVDRPAHRKKRLKFLREKLKTQEAALVENDIQDISADSEKFDPLPDDQKWMIVNRDATKTEIAEGEAYLAREPGKAVSFEQAEEWLTRAKKAKKNSSDVAEVAIEMGLPGEAPKKSVTGYAEAIVDILEYISDDIYNIISDPKETRETQMKMLVSALDPRLLNQIGEQDLFNHHIAINNLGAVNVTEDADTKPEIYSMAEKILDTFHNEPGKPDEGQAEEAETEEPSETTATEEEEAETEGEPQAPVEGLAEAEALVESMSERVRSEALDGTLIQEKLNYVVGAFEGAIHDLKSGRTEVSIDRSDASYMFEYYGEAEGFFAELEDFSDTIDGYIRRESGRDTDETYWAEYGPRNDERKYEFDEGSKGDTYTEVSDATLPDVYRETTSWTTELFSNDQITISMHKKNKDDVVSQAEADETIQGWKDHAKAQDGVKGLDGTANSKKTMLFLFEESGKASQPYVDAGYTVYSLDAKNGVDIDDIDVDVLYDHIENPDDVYGVVAFCPCTAFSSASNARSFPEMDKDGRTEAAKQLVFNTLDVIEKTRPQFWMIENPRGSRIGQSMAATKRNPDQEKWSTTGLGKPALNFSHYHYGNDFNKPTSLWGNFNTDLPTANLGSSKKGTANTPGSKTAKTKMDRSATPEGFAYSFFMANNYLDATDQENLHWHYPQSTGAVDAALEAGLPAEKIYEVGGYMGGRWDDGDLPARDIYDAVQDGPGKAARREKEVAEGLVSIDYAGTRWDAITAGWKNNKSQGIAELRVTDPDAMELLQDHAEDLGISTANKGIKSRITVAGKALANMNRWYVDEMAYLAQSVYNGENIAEARDELVEAMSPPNQNDHAQIAKALNVDTKGNTLQALSFAINDIMANTMGSAEPEPAQDTDGLVNFDGTPALDGDVQIDAMGPGGAEVRKRRSRKGRRVPYRATKMGISRSSRNAAVFVDAGLTPDEARVLPIETQFRIASDQVKKMFGFKAVNKAPNLNGREAVDVLMDLYRNLQVMADMMQMPPEMISFRGKAKSLYLYRNVKGGPLAYHGLNTGSTPTSFHSGVQLAPGEQELALGRRNDSFTHEWGHALDGRLLYDYASDLMNQGEGRLLTGKIRDMGKDASKMNLDQRVRDALGDLLNALFFDEAKLALYVMDLEKKIANARDPNSKLQQEHRRKLKEIEQGSSKARKPSSIMRQVATKRGDKTEDAQAYWQSPTEMFARSFEAFFADKFLATGELHDSLTQRDELYRIETLNDMAAVYPAPGDRKRVFLAWENMIDALEQVNYLDGKSKIPIEEAKVKVQEVSSRIEKPRRKIFEQTKSRLGEQRRLQAEKFTAARKANRLKQRLGKTPTRTDKLVAWTDDSVGSLTAGVFQTIRGNILQLGRKYPGNSDLRQIKDWFATDPGAGKSQGLKFEQAVRQTARRFSSRLHRVVIAHDLDKLSAKESEDFYRFMVSTEDNSIIAGALGEKQLAAAADVRRIMDDLHAYLTSMGIILGYTKNGYMPRVIDEMAVRMQGGEKGFVSQATKVYEIVFEEHIVDKDKVSDGDQEAQEALWDQAKRYSRKYTKNKPVRWSDDAEIAMEAVNKVLKKLNKAIADAAEAKENGENTDAAEGRVALHQEKLAEVMSELYPHVQLAWADESAQHWYEGVVGYKGNAFSGQKGMGKSDFERGRMLPVETEELMGEFLITDPLELVATYILRASRRGQMAGFFGAESEKGSKGRGPGWKLDDAFEGLHDSEMDAADQDELRRSVGLMIGKYNTNITKRGLSRKSTIQTVFMPFMLQASIFSQLAEPMTIGLRGAGSRDSQIGELRGLLQPWRALFEDASTWLPKKIRPKTPEERSLWRKEMAEFTGLVADADAEEVMSNRYNLMYQTPENSKRIARFFKWTGIHGHAMAMRRAAMAKSFQYINAMATRVLDEETSEAGKKSARAALRELGITDEHQIEAMAGLGVQPEVADLENNPYLDDVLTAVGLFVDEAVVDPKAVDKPALASQPEFAHMYGILSFVAGFQRVLIRFGKVLLSNEYDGNMRRIAMGAFVALLMGQTLSWMLREGLLGGHDDAEEWWEKVSDPGNLIWNGLSRTGVFGLLDPFINAVRSNIKYDSELSDLGLGAVYSYSVNTIESMMVVFSEKNSPNTNTAERKAFKALWDFLGALSLYAAMNSPFAPVAPTVTLMAGSRKAKNAAANALFPPTASELKRKGKGDRTVDRSAPSRGTNRSVPDR